MLTTDQKATQVYKKHKEVADTHSGKAFFNEGISSPITVLYGNVWKDYDQIPTTAPSSLADQETEGVVKRFIDLQLIAVAGSPDAFYHDELKDAIPFNYGDGSYNFMTTLKDNLDTSLPPGYNDFEVDTVAGTLRFYGGAPANMPPKISFYKYVGTKGNGQLQGTIPADSSINIPIGLQSENTSIFIEGDLERGSLFDAVRVMVAIPSSGLPITDGGYFISWATGISFAVDLDGDNVRLNVFADNSDANSTEFRYSVTKKRR